LENIHSYIKRYYTKVLDDKKDLSVYDLFNWKRVDVILKNYKTGEIITDMRDLEFPEQYSQNACDIIASKYFRKAGIKEKDLDYENSMKQVAHRMVGFWMEALIREGLLEREESNIFYDEMVFGLINQMYAPNSPQWFNTGLKYAYDITGEPQGNYYFDPDKNEVVLTKDNYSRTQASACFILSIEDKLLGANSITDHFVTETKLFKGGSGTGTNFSNIRAEGERLSGGGVSSGLMSFLKALDRNAGAIKSGGTTRRAAKMVCLDEDHPEILRFINWKFKEEEKVKALAKMGYDADINGEAYETVSGQNSNNSVRFSDDFMRKITDLDNNPDATITLNGRADSLIDREIKVKDIWDSFIKSAWSCADPAPLFKDTFNAWHTCPAGEDGNLNASYNQINSTNPCGEYCFLDDTSCNLASINLYKFYDADKREFDVEGFLHLISLTQLVLEASIFHGQFPTIDIARKTYNFRTTGLGVSNLASLLLAMGHPYDSEKARAITQVIIGILTGQSYYISSLMAEKIGAFEKYSLNREHMIKVIRNHIRVVNPNILLNSKEIFEKGIDINNYEDLEYTPYIPDRSFLKESSLSPLLIALEKSWQNALLGGEKFGFRNAQVSVLAPTGTISYAMDSNATSIEPFFSHIAYKKLVGGGSMVISNPVINYALKSLGYSDAEIDEIMKYILVDGKIEGAPHLKEEHLPIFDTANRCGSGKRYIRPMGHVLMMAAIAPMISGAISKTVNLPKEATISDIENIIISSWKLGIKGLTVYRDSSKVSQPLNTSLTDSKNVDLENLTYETLLNYAKLLKENRQKSTTSYREKVVGIRTGRTHPAQIEDVKIYTTVNRRENNEISEVYITTQREGSIITGLLNSLSKAISVMLQYHVPAKDISKMLRGQKYEPYGFVQNHPYIKYVTSISDLISKIIDIELGDFSRVQVKPETDENSASLKSHPLHVKTANNEVSEINGENLYDVVCSTCSSSKMVKNGTCMVCLDCGSTTGCS